MPLRILVTLHNFAPEPTMGAETVAIAQTRELLRAGHRMALFYAGNAPPLPGQLSALGLADLTLFRIRYLQTKAQVLLSTRKPWVERVFAKVLHSFRPDVVLFHHLVRLSLGLPLVAARAGIPTAYFLHDHYWLCPSYSLFDQDATICPGGSPGRCTRCLYETHRGEPPGLALAALGALAISWRRRVVQQALDKIDLFISPSQSLINEAAARGVTLAPAVVVPNGQDFAPRLPPAAPAPGMVRFGYIGGVYSKKGLDVLVQAFSGSLGRRLTIRGFTNAESMEAFRKDHPTFQGRLQLFDADRTDFYRDVDVVVVPSLWLENQPIVVLEALAHGRPVLASRIGGLPEMFDEGRGGRFFTAGDADSLRRTAEELDDIPGAVTELAARIPAWLKWDHSTSRLTAHLEALVKTTPP